jgi:toxin ParE1/3/4
LARKNNPGIYKKSYALTEQAQSDLREIWEYIAEANERAAIKLVKELFGKFRLLAENAGLGTRRDEMVIGLRSFPHKKYVVFYLEMPEGVEIYRVLHSSRDIEGLFEEFFEGLPE